MRYLAEVGWDFRGILGFLETLEAGEEVSLGEAWSSHPPAAERMRRLLEIAKEDRLEPNGVFLTERFAQYKDLAR